MAGSVFAQAATQEQNTSPLSEDRLLPISAFACQCHARTVVCNELCIVIREQNMEPAKMK